MEDQHQDGGGDATDRPSGRSSNADVSLPPSANAARSANAEQNAQPLSRHTNSVRFDSDANGPDAGHPAGVTPLRLHTKSGRTKSDGAGNVDNDTHGSDAGRRSRNGSGSSRAADPAPAPPPKPRFAIIDGMRFVPVPFEDIPRPTIEEYRTVFSDIDYEKRGWISAGEHESSTKAIG